MDLNKLIRKRLTEARKNKLATLAAYTLIISEIDRLKGNKDPWTKTLQTGEPSDEVVIKIMDRMLKSELERVGFGGAPDTALQFVLLTHLPKTEKISEQDLRDWIVNNIDFSSLKSPNQAIGITRKALGEDKVDMDLLKEIITELTKLS